MNKFKRLFLKWTTYLFCMTCWEEYVNPTKLDILYWERKQRIKDLEKSIN